MLYEIIDNEHMGKSYVSNKYLKGWQRDLTDLFRNRRLERIDEFEAADAFVEKKSAIEALFDAGEVGESQMIEAILDLDP